MALSSRSATHFIDGYAAEAGTRPELDRVVAFLNEIGIRCALKPGASGFLRGVLICQGGLHIDLQANLSDVLHEAGHLAVLPGRFRPMANGNVDAVQMKMGDTIDFSNPDAGEARAALQSGDGEATAWAWAAGVHIGLRPEMIVRDADYGRTGREVRLALSMSSFPGINGLSSAGFCVVRPGPLERIRGLPAYPKLAMWVQKDFSVQGLEPAGQTMKA